MHNSVAIKAYHECMCNSEEEREGGGGGGGGGGREGMVVGERLNIQVIMYVN